MKNLSREDMMEAVSEGVRRAIVELNEGENQFNPPKSVYDAIQRGMYDAIWSVATNATGAPCADFYDFIKDGVKEAVEQLGSEVKLKVVKK